MIHTNKFIAGIAQGFDGFVEFQFCFAVVAVRLFARSSPDRQNDSANGRSWTRLSDLDWVQSLYLKTNIKLSTVCNGKQ